MDEKDAAQAALAEAASCCPVGVYAHRNGGEYVVYGHSIDEATLVPLVHYFSIAKRSRWTRTIINFTEQGSDGAARFRRIRDATDDEILEARIVGLTIQ